MKYPVGPQAMKRAAQTEPGKLAALLNRVLYSADYRDVPLPGSMGKTEARRWVAEDQVFKNNDEMPKSVPACGNNACYFETEALMRAIRDYLEFRSLEEVIP